MATQQFRVYAARGGPQKLVSSFPGSQDQKALAFADKLFEDKKVSSIRVTLEMSDPATGRTRATTVVERNRDEPKPAPKGKAGEQASDARAGRPEAQKPADANKAKPAEEAAKAKAEEAESGEGLFGIDPATTSIAIKGGSALAGAGLIGASTYMASSSLISTTVPNYATIAGATIAFLLAYVVIFVLLLSEEEAHEIRQLFTPAPKPPELKVVQKRKPAQAGDAKKPQKSAEPPAKPEEPEFAIRADRLQALQKAQVWVITFLHQSLAQVTGSGRHLVQGRLDRSTSLATQLFFAGVCEGYAVERGLDHNELRWIAREGLSKIAFDTVGARNFALHYQEYLVKPRYFDMVRAGVEGMHAHLKGDLRGVHLLLAALDRHHQKRNQTPKDETHAVLFTKLVRDANAPEFELDPDHASLIKVHDDIVRAALLGSAGREVRHMGDGIMAVFQRPHDAITAAAEIQRFVIGYNARREQRQELHLRIGINAGKPIGDVPVPSAGIVALAQRLAAEGASEEILLTESVRTQMAGGKFAALPIGQRQFRGFRDPVLLFSLNWREDPILRVS